MKPFRKHKGKVAPLHRANIDTDQIIPKQFLKRIERTGFGEFLFYDWRRAKHGGHDLYFSLHLLALRLDPPSAHHRRGLPRTAEIPHPTRHCPLEGLDDIGLTLKHEAEIT